MHKPEQAGQPDIPAIRKAMRRHRGRLSPTEQLQHSASMCSRVCSHPLFLNARRIAVYLACDGEIDPAGIMDRAWQLGKKVYLPVLAPIGGDHLWFTRFRPESHLVTNRYGIPEPCTRRRKTINPAALDLVITPLVAFDAYGQRLGMGGGFYDRTFAFRKRRSHWHKPFLLGVAYDFQQAPTLAARKWDIPLDALATETRLVRY